MTRRYGSRQAGRERGGRAGRQWLPRAVLALLPVLLLNACEAVRPYDRGADGSVVYLDQRPAVEQAAARAAIVRILNQGTPVYALRPGDEFTIFFNIRREPTPSGYRIRPGDKLRVDFLDTTQASSDVLVQPDGRISLPLIGAVEAAGKTAGALTRELEERYATTQTKPQLTVNLTETHSPLDEFIHTIESADRSRTITAKLMPDGTISLPLLHPIGAAGLTLDELRAAVDAAYRRLGLDVSVSLVARDLRPGTAMIFGEVPKPGEFALDKPHTVLMAVAQAGGVTLDGSLKDVRVFYIGRDGEPHLRVIDLQAEIDNLQLGDDMILPSNSVVYVPTTAIAKVARMADLVLRQILRYQGFSFGANYILDNPKTGNTVVVP